MALPIVTTTCALLMLWLPNISFMVWYLTNLWRATVARLSDLMVLLSAGLSLMRSDSSALSWKPFERCQCCKMSGSRISHWRASLGVAASSH
jgi:hypothetical protein